MKAALVGRVIQLREYHRASSLITDFNADPGHRAKLAGSRRDSWFGARDQPRQPDRPAEAGISFEGERISLSSAEGGAFSARTSWSASAPCSVRLAGQVSAWPTGSAGYVQMVPRAADRDRPAPSPTSLHPDTCRWSSQGQRCARGAPK